MCRMGSVDCGETLRRRERERCFFATWPAVCIPFSSRLEPVRAALRRALGVSACRRTLVFTNLRLLQNVSEPTDSAQVDVGRTRPLLRERTTRTPYEAVSRQVSTGVDAVAADVLCARKKQHDRGRKERGATGD